MNVIVEIKCEGCTDGRVPDPMNEYGESIQCIRCKGTALEQRALPAAEVFETFKVNDVTLLGRVATLESEVRILRERLKRLDGHPNSVQEYTLPRSSDYNVYGGKSVHDFEAERVKRLAEWCKGNVY